ncbi:MAG TPA: hypothetical protein VGK94_07820 [Candidatus Polarisedimenticolia bacterium]
MSEQTVTTSPAVQIVGPDAVALVESTERQLVALSGPVMIVTAQDTVTAAERITLIGTIRDALETKRTELKRPHLEKSRAIDELFQPLIRKCDERKATIGTDLKTWHRNEQERARKERERIDKENADRAAAALAEQKRIDDEARAVAEKEALDAGFTKDEATTYGKLQEAEAPRVAVMQELAPPPPPKTIQSAIGTVSVRKGQWTYEVQSLKFLPRVFLRLDPGKVGNWKEQADSEWLRTPLELLMPDVEALKAAVKAGVRQIPGVKIFQDEVVSRGRS